MGKRQKRNKLSKGQLIDLCKTIGARYDGKRIIDGVCKHVITVNDTLNTFKTLQEAYEWVYLTATGGRRERVKELLLINSLKDKFSVDGKENDHA